jgi:hypothetical protein
MECVICGKVDFDLDGNHKCSKEAVKRFNISRASKEAYLSSRRHRYGRGKTFGEKVIDGTLMTMRAGNI